LAHQNDRVKAGDPIVNIDRQYIEKQGYDLTTMLIITNPNNKKIKLKTTGKVNTGDKLN